MFAGFEIASGRNGLPRLTTLSFSGDVAEIGAEAFAWDKGLTTATFSGTVGEIGEEAFYGCTSLTDVTFAKSVRKIGKSAFSGRNGLPRLTTLSFSGDVAEIGAEAFAWDKGLTTVTFSGTVGEIGEEAFYGCTSLTDVTFAKSVRKIGPHAFGNCSNLKTVTIPTSVESLAANAFPPGTRIVRENILPKSTMTDIASAEVRWKIEGKILLGPEKKSRLIGEVDIPEGLGITKIAPHAFQGCTTMKSLSIPEGVSAVGDGAFENCRKLSKVALPSTMRRLGRKSFSGCSQLKDICLPKKVEYLGERAFEDCWSLTNANCACKVKSLREGVFSGCEKLRSVELPPGVECLEDRLFQNCKALDTVVLPDSVVKIGSEAYSGCTALKSIRFPDRMESIGTSVFCYCESLRSISLPSGLKEIPAELFRSCKGVQAVTMPEGVEHVSRSAFAKCESLMTVTLPSSLMRIEYAAFKDCSSLEEIVFPQSLKSIEAEAFSGCKSLYELLIPPSVDMIQKSAFESCSSLEQVTFLGTNTVADKTAFPKNVRVGVPQDGKEVPLIVTGTPFVNARLEGCKNPWIIPRHLVIEEELGIVSIQDRAFYKSPALVSIKIPKSVKSIGNGAFSGCSKLKTVDLGEGVEEIGDYAFQKCSQLAEIRIPSGIVKTGKKLFDQCPLFNVEATPKYFQELLQRRDDAPYSLPIRETGGLFLVDMEGLGGGLKLRDVVVGKKCKDRVARSSGVIGKVVKGHALIHQKDGISKLELGFANQTGYPLWIRKISVHRGTAWNAPQQELNVDVMLDAWAVTNVTHTITMDWTPDSKNMRTSTRFERVFCEDQYGVELTEVYGLERCTSETSQSSDLSSQVVVKASWYQTYPGFLAQLLGTVVTGGLLSPGLSGRWCMELEIENRSTRPAHVTKMRLTDYTVKTADIVDYNLDVVVKPGQRQSCKVSVLGPAYDSTDRVWKGEIYGCAVLENYFSIKLFGN